MPSRTLSEDFYRNVALSLFVRPIASRDPAHTRTHPGHVPLAVPVVMSAIAASAASAARLAAPRAPAQRRSGSAVTRRSFSQSTAARPSVRAKALSVDPEEDGLNRRDALIALVSAVATPALLYGATDSEREEAREAGVPAEPLALAGALRAQTVYAGFCIPIIEKNVSASYETLISLAFRDAGSFDAVTGTGGLNGSVGSSWTDREQTIRGRRGAVGSGEARDRRESGRAAGGRTSSRSHPSPRPGTSSCATSAASRPASSRVGSTRRATSTSSAATTTGCSPRPSAPRPSRSKPRAGSARTTPVSGP